LEDQICCLTPGHHADFTLFPAHTNNPLLEMLESPTLPTAIWIEGNQLTCGTGFQPVSATPNKNMGEKLKNPCHKKQSLHSAPAFRLVDPRHHHLMHAT